MFERRLKVFLFFLAVTTAVLIARAVQIQLIERNEWASKASESLQDKTFTETSRGRLLDAHGNVLAMDVASMDVCVDYRAIPLDPDPKSEDGLAFSKWVREIASARIKANPATDTRVSKQQRFAEEVQSVKNDISDMWKQLAREGDLSDDEMDDYRRTIVHRVEMSRRYLWYHKKQQDAVKAQRNADAAAHSGVSSPPTTRTGSEPPPPPAILAWLNGETDVAPTDDFDIKVAEQTEPHVILRAIKPETFNRLGKQQEHLPGLVLRSNMDREYPLNEIACHVLGHLNDVEFNDMTNDPNSGDELRDYRKNDLVGRGGLEGLCEPLLRGTRGRTIKTIDDTGTHTETIDPKAGEDVTTTLDVDLEAQLRDAFNQVPVQLWKDDPMQHIDLHGAAVVLDVATDSVLAMVSVPTYDQNQYEKLYPTLKKDVLNQPLFNLATMASLETGSTIKPVVGIGAITQGVMGISDTIECKGYLEIHGKRYPFGRCWTLSKFPDAGELTIHHRIPEGAPHPTGFLTFPDALERSCNIFFENMGDRLGLDGLSHWMGVFGLGRQTGIGIPEARGRLPNSVPSTFGQAELNQAKWFGGIGQGQVGASPLQMANVAATLARDGLWMRPHLVPTDTMRELARRSTATIGYRWSDVPEQVQLPISAEAVAAAKEGMKRVANSAAGTGVLERKDGLIAAGKTGTAQAAPFTIPTLDENMKPVFDEKGKKLSVPLQPSSFHNPNKLVPWYLGYGEQGTDLKHSWYIGFAPADHPRVAFAVLVEYGGSGGGPAKFIANEVLSSCIELGYIPKPITSTTAP